MFIDEFMDEYDAFMTDNGTEPVDIDGFFYDRFIPGDYVEDECVHAIGEYAEHFPFCGPYFAPYATFTCADCGAEFEV